MDEDFRKRLRKTLYCGDLEPEAASLSLTDLSVEYFQGLAPHNLGYIDLHSASNVTSHDTVSTSSVAMGMIYAKRLQRKRPDYVGKMSSSDLFLISMMMASKYLYDEGVDEEVFNDEWAENADMEKDEINRMEREFLDAMDWELFIKKDEFDRAMVSIERSIALREGLKRGWFSYTDMCIVWSDPRLRLRISDIGLEWLKIAMVSSAAYFAAAMTMVGSTVLVMNAPLVLTSSGVLPVLMPGSHLFRIPLIVFSPTLQGLPTLPAVDLPSMFPGNSGVLRPNETAGERAEEELTPESSIPDPSWVPGSTVLETIMSQLMAVLTLKSHLMQFVSAVADNYTAKAHNITKTRHEPRRIGCTSQMTTGSSLEDDEPSAKDADYSRWMDLEQMFAGSGRDINGPENCCCCGKQMSDGRNQNSWGSRQSLFSRACSDRLSTGQHRNDGISCCRYQAASTVEECCSGPCQCRYLKPSSWPGRCGDGAGSLGVHHLFPDITIGFATSMLPLFYAT